MHQGAGCKGTQTFGGTHQHRWRLIVEGAGVRMPGDAKMLVRPSPVFMANVPLADIAGDDHNMFGGVEGSGIARSHGDTARGYESKGGGSLRTKPRATARIAGQASVAARAAAAVSARRALALLRFIDLERASLEVGAVERLHGATGIRIRHLDETEAAQAPGFPICDQGDFIDGTVLRKKRTDAVIGSREREISNK